MHSDNSFEVRMDVSSSRQVTGTTVVEWIDGTRRSVHDEVVVEEPLEIRVKGVPVSVTMRTPGDDGELAVGFLVTEGIISSREDVRGIENGADDADDADRPNAHNIVDVALRVGLDVDLERLRRNVFAASSCGVCGKASIDAVRVRGLMPPARDVRLSPDVLRGMTETLRAGQTVFGRTGGLHAAGIFDLDGRMLAIREDVGRHNAVDKIIGHAVLTGEIPLARSVLVVSGRGGFEIVQKAIAASIPIVAAVSAPSSLAVQLARDMGQTFVGFLRGGRFVIYSGEERLPSAPGDTDTLAPR
jgi:FdhD protein